MNGEGWSLKLVVEAILFASQGPVSMKDLQGILKSAAEAEKDDSSVAAFARIKEGALRAAIDELAIDCADASRAYELRESAAGWQLVTKAGICSLAAAALPGISFGSTQLRPLSKRSPSLPTASRSRAPISKPFEELPWTASCKRSSIADSSRLPAEPKFLAGLCSTKPHSISWIILASGISMNFPTPTNCAESTLPVASAQVSAASGQPEAAFSGEPSKRLGRESAPAFERSKQEERP